MPLTHNERRRLHALKIFLEQNIERPRQEELIKAYALKETKLSRGFKELFGMTIYQYWRNAAMHYAKAELHKGADVKELASRIGYANYQNFVRSFKKIFAITPAQARKLQ